MSPSRPERTEIDVRSHFGDEGKSLSSSFRAEIGSPGYSRNGIYGIVASGGEPCGTPHALYSNPFAFRTVWAAGEERNVTSALAASV